MPFAAGVDTCSRNSVSAGDGPGLKMSALHAQLQRMLDAPPAWWRSYLPALQSLCDMPAAASVADLLNELVCSTAVASFPVRFVTQGELPAGEAYESFIARTATVPTRDNLHDLFNGLMWLSWPQTKLRLNRLQAAQINAQGVTGTRGALRDALTVFDENAALMHAPEPLIAALRRRDWAAVFGDCRDLWARAEVKIFGHALLEKLMQPRKAITAHVWVVSAVNDVDVAASLDPERLMAKDFLPLPVLGVPGWWSPNEQPDFYQDAQVFRPMRRMPDTSAAPTAGVA